VCLRASLTWVRVRFIPPFAVSALKHGCSEALPTFQLIPTARVSAAWAAARDRQHGVNHAKHGNGAHAVPILKRENTSIMQNALTNCSRLAKAVVPRPWIMFRSNVKRLTQLD